LCAFDAAGKLARHIRNRLHDEAAKTTKSMRLPPRPWLTPKSLLFLLTLQLAACGGSSPSTPPSLPPATATPVQHVIIVIGENHSFDNIFGVYQPPDPHQQIWNLLSQQIVTVSGAPGANFSRAAQHQAVDNTAYQISPPQTGAFSTLPQPNTTLTALLFPPAVEYGITSDPGLAPGDQSLLNDGGIFPQVQTLPDKRFPSDLPDGPFPITQYVKYSDTVGDPVHRFYQMWQEIDCNAANISSSNPSGCNADLFPWVATSVGWGTSNTPPPTPFTDQSTWQGAVSMGFYNMAAGDVPYFAGLANTYAISDNYHQFMLGGTGPNSISIGTAAPLIYSDANGNPATPPALQVENPNPFVGSNNWYQQEGFYIVDSGNESNSSYTNCSDSSQPGVQAIFQYLAALPYKPFNGGNCAPGAYYLLNNQLPAYYRDGSLRGDQSHTVGPSSVPTIGDALSAAGISWSYYGEGYSPGLGSVYSHYCGICNPFEYAPSIMITNLISNIKDLTQFYHDVQDGTLPAVSFIKPDDIVDSHPGSSLPLLFEAFCRNLVETVTAQNSLWQQTAIFITFDESGGYYDSGYIQPIDFFGDGPRIPLIVVSPYAKPGFVDHTYADHASLLKFIEKNWGLQPLSSRSRDNLPNPTSAPAAPYFPTNPPAAGDLMTLFQFSP
jgi:phospholipase C